MRHFINTQDWSIDELQSLLAEAARLKRDPIQPRLQGRTISLLFFNPSLRTRTSFQIGAAQLGMTAVVLEPGKGVWGIEFDPGKTMDGEAEEHVIEVAAVLSRYCDLIAMRAFPGFKNWQYDRDDPLIKTLRPIGVITAPSWPDATRPSATKCVMSRGLGARRCVAPPRRAFSVSH